MKKKSDDDKSLVVKHNTLIEARYKLSVRQQRVILTLISMISKEDTDFHRYTLQISKIYNLLGLKKESLETKRKILKDVLKGLQRNIIEIKTSTDEGEILTMPAWIETPQFQWNIDKISLRISEFLKPYLLQIQDHFTSYPLKEAVRFRREYSFRFFEFCKNHEPHSKYNSGVADGRYVKNVKYKIRELREILGIPNNIYPRIYDFKNRVLLPAQKEIREKTSADFDFKLLKTGRKYTHIELIIKGGEIPKTEAPPEETKSLADADLKTALIEFGISETASVRLMEERGAEEIREALLVCGEYRQSLKKNDEQIRMPDKIIKKALEEGWKSAETRRREDREKEERKQKERLEEKEAHEKLQEGIRKQKAEKIQRQLEEIEEEDARRRRELEENKKEYRDHSDKSAYIVGKLPKKDYESLGTEYRENIKKEIEETIIPQASEFHEAIARSVDALLREIEAEKNDAARRKFFEKLRENGEMDKE